MEVVEVCTKTKYRTSPSCQPTTSSYKTPVNQCSRMYIQPPRIPSYAPKKLYKPPTKPFDANTTYHVSFLNTPQYLVRTKSIQPTQILKTIEGKFQDDTTNRLCYKPVWEVVKAQPFVPIRRKFIAHNPMQTSTTAREDFGPKNIERPMIIIPVGNIKFCSGPMEDRTTSAIAFTNPGFVRPPASYKPASNYSPSHDPSASETTNMLSYQPYRLERREKYPWTQKPVYKLPQTSMDVQTTYSKSYTEIEIVTKAKPIIPMSGGEWFEGNRKFHGRTCYSDAYIPRTTEPKSIPIVPRVNIKISNKKMASDTTNKLSYQSVRTERRIPFRPRRRNIMGNGTMQSMTTNKLDYQFKTTQRPEIIIPCDNIRHSNKPLEDSTTSAMSYMHHEFTQPSTSFKPSNNYKKSSLKLDADTINKLSYRPWTPAPRKIIPWSKKNSYKRPKERMVGDSIYNTSFRPPGYYIEKCESLQFPNTKNENNPKIPNESSNNNCIPVVESVYQ